MIKMTELVIDNFINNNIVNKKVTITPFIFLANIKSNIAKGAMHSSGNTELKCNTNHNEVEELFVNNLNVIKINKNVFINLSNITHINFNNNGMNKITKKFLLLKNLRILSLDNNQIISLPNYTFELTSLEVLSLNHNQISFIPSSIQFLTKLKIFEISYNKVDSLPIEFGLLKNLDILHIDNNYFTKIPSTLCYLKNLKEIKLEWMEFLDPPMPKIMLDQTFIQNMRNTLQDLITHSILFCEYDNFIFQFSQNIQKKIKEEAYLNSFETEKNDSNILLQNIQIFTAINNNYIGVAKALIQSNEENLKAKNQDNKTPLYLSIQQSKSDLIDLFLSKTNFKNYPNSYIYLHKAIRVRNFNLVVKLYQMGLDFTLLDEKGNNCYHVLFSFFNKNYDKCCMIGNFFIEKNIPGINKFNFDKWAPIHLAARYSSCECINWITKINKLLANQKKEIVDINIKGKNNWTPLHLALSAYRYSESAFFIYLGCDLFCKTIDGRRPKKVTNNYFLTKMVTTKENEYYFHKYLEKQVPKVNMKYKCKLLTDVTKNKEELNTSFESIGTITTTLLNPDISVYQKMKSLSILKISYSVSKIESVVAELIEQVDINNAKLLFVISEICDIIVSYNLTNVVPLLKQAHQVITKKNSYVYAQIYNTLELMKTINYNQYDAFISVKKDIDDFSEDDNNEVNDENDSSRTEKNYLMYFEDEEETIKMDRDFFSEMNNTMVVDNIKMNQKYNTENIPKVKVIHNDTDKVGVIKDNEEDVDPDCFSDSMIIQQDDNDEEG